MFGPGFPEFPPVPPFPKLFPRGLKLLDIGTAAGVLLVPAFPLGPGTVPGCPLFPPFPPLKLKTFAREVAPPALPFPPCGPPFPCAPILNGCEKG